MATTDAGSATTRLGLWPKLVLWSLVLVFGVLYLGSVKRNPVVDPPSTVIPSPTSPAPEVAPSPGDVGSEPVGQAVEGDDRTAAPASAPAEQARVPDEAPESEPVRAAESAAFVDSLLSKEVAGESPGESPDPTGPEAGSSPGGTTDGTLASPVAATASTATTTEQGAPEPDAPPRAEVAAPPDLPAPGPGIGAGSREAQEAQRAHILREYEAMRRAADEQMRQYWQQMGVPAPAAMPYGPPGYGPWGYPQRH